MKVETCNLCQNIGLSCTDIPKGAGGARAMDWKYSGLTGVNFESIDNCPTRILKLQRPLIEKCKDCIYKFISQPHG